ncbi:autotransporter outer membrane beta-barrel domain-containing protein [Cognatiyoonia sp. IB215182]|uniref:autotransporter family protein n=1 Tax=Cognatiyoonia sp. IB215182 TaxID=3097353 RepID=UPI002A0E4C04|nr:autotransporter outer membrane beta-barrel domain-containing protein [Cognatiyoonia sp. IB215182]MDX8355372.1 autotransporter outer membrane beta-barrel domain-containing protein [Cognatiyoonia sp. IB215182]
MKNEPLDIQPVVRPLNVFIRGGRLTKFKGQVASLAPGCLVAATAAVLFTGGAAHADNECGTDRAGQDTVTCGASDSSYPNYTDGINYAFSDGLTLILPVPPADGPSIEVSGKGVSVSGSGTGEGEISVQIEGGAVTTTGIGGFGVVSFFTNGSGTAAATVHMTDGAVNTTGDLADGLVVGNSGAGEARAQMVGGTVTTSGEDAVGISAISLGGQAVVDLGVSATVTASGAGADGIHVQGASGFDIDVAGVVSGGAFREATSTKGAINGAAIRTTSSPGGTIDIDSGAEVNAGMSGLAIQDGDGDAVVTSAGELTGDVRLGAGDDSLTISSTATYDFSYTLDGGEGGDDHLTLHGQTMTSMENVINWERLTMIGGSVTTQGADAHGLNAVSEGGPAVVDLGENAVVTASGMNADGIRAEGATGFDVDVVGRLTGGADNGAAIRTISSAGGMIDIASGATVTAGDSRIAIQDGDGGTEIMSAGTVTGAVRLGVGDDILTLTSGRFTGDIYAGAGNDTVTISAATEYDGSYILDGGAGDNDQLILSGRTMTSMENVSDWEHLTLKDGTKLSLDKGSRLDMDLSIEAGSVFSMSGGGTPTGTSIAGKVANASGSAVTIVGDVTNSGTLSVQDRTAGDVITIEGNYTGSGSSVFALDARMDDDGVNTDRLEITGDASGETMLLIAGLDSIAPTDAPLELNLVTVGGASDDATFTLMGNYVTPEEERTVISGAYLYRLVETGGGWGLNARSKRGEVTYQPSAPLYDSYGASLLAFNAPSGLDARGSAQDFRSLAWGGAGADAADQDTGTPLWIRMGTEQLTTSEEHSTTGAALESSLWEMEIGADLTLNSSDAGLLVGGLMFSYGTGSTDVSSDLGDGSIETSGLGLGLAATWYDARRFYVDGQVTLTSYTSDLTSDRLGTLTEGNSGTGYALSLEAGQQLDLGTRLTVTPQSQLSLSSVTFSDFTSEAHQEAVALSDATSQQLRLGLEVAAQERGESGLYGIVNLYHEFGAGSEVEVAGTSLTTEREPWTLGAGLGGSYVLTERVDLFGDVAYATGLSNAGDTSALSANAGLKVVF